VCVCEREYVREREEKKETTQLGLKATTLKNEIRRELNTLFKVFACIMCMLQRCLRDLYVP